MREGNERGSDCQNTLNSKRTLIVFPGGGEKISQITAEAIISLGTIISFGESVLLIAAFRGATWLFDMVVELVMW